MTIRIEHLQYQLNEALILRDRSNSSFDLHCVTLVLNKLEEDEIECRLTFQINLELYQRIEAESLFNLKPAILVPLSNAAFLPDLDIQLEISLQPDFLPLLVENVTCLEEPGEAFLHLNQEQPNHRLFLAENWLLVSAQQAQASGQVGYRTLWDYLNPATLAQAATAGSADPISDALGKFFTDWTQNHLSASDDATAEVINGITHFLEGVVSVNLEEFTKLVQNIDQQLTEGKWNPPSFKKSIEQQMLHFFTEDDWSFTKLKGQPVLQLAFQGKNSQWTCYAKAREESQQFVFYSICPISAPEEKRQAIAEFLTRANYGMTIGNFELDYSDGEICYKTSIDVEGAQLTDALVKRLVYTNVIMMDEYLPGIKAVIETNILPEAAIRAIEHPENNPISA